VKYLLLKKNLNFHLNWKTVFEHFVGTMNICYSSASVLLVEGHLAYKNAAAVQIGSLGTWPDLKYYGKVGHSKQR